MCDHQQFLCVVVIICKNLPSSPSLLGAVGGGGAEHPPAAGGSVGEVAWGEGAWGEGAWGEGTWGEGACPGGSPPPWTLLPPVRGVPFLQKNCALCTAKE